jgi:hypothetical protein
MIQKAITRVEAHDPKNTSSCTTFGSTVNADVGRLCSIGVADWN